MELLFTDIQHMISCSQPPAHSKTLTLTLCFFIRVQSEHQSPQSETFHVLGSPPPTELFLIIQITNSLVQIHAGNSSPDSFLGAEGTYSENSV